MTIALLFCNLEGLVANPVSPTAAFSYRYLYDSLGQLQVADNSLDDTADVGVGSPTTYDRNGNISSMKLGVDTANNYIYASGTNKVQSRNGSGTQFAYDLNGNDTLSVRKGLSVQYDPFTQMSMKITKAGETISYEYDGAKRRILKTDTKTTTVSTLYLHGRNEYPLIERATNQANDLYYIYGPTGLIAMQQGGNSATILKDHLGSVRAVVCNSGLSSTYDYQPFGVLWRSTVSTGTRYGFTGQEYDVESGLWNFRARFYEDSLGRFYATDPAEQSFSPYSYAANNPMSFVDPTGRMRQESAMDWVDLNSRLAMEDLGYYGNGDWWGGGGDASWGAAEAFEEESGFHTDGIGGSYVGSVHVYGQPHTDEQGHVTLGEIGIPGCHIAQKTYCFITGFGGWVGSDDGGHYVTNGYKLYIWTETTWEPGNGGTTNGFTWVPPPGYHFPEYQGNGFGTDNANVRKGIAVAALGLVVDGAHGIVVNTPGLVTKATTFSKVLRGAGTVFGVYGVYLSTSRAIENPTLGNIGEALLDGTVVAFKEALEPGVVIGIGISELIYEESQEGR